MRRRELLAAAAADTDSTMLSEVIDMQAGADKVEVTRPVYAGKLLSDVAALTDGTLFLTLRTRAFKANPVDEGASADVTTVEPVLAEDDIATKVESFAAELLTDETESVLLGALAEFPRIVAQSAELREPHRVARYLEQLAAAYHKWYDTCRVTPQGDDPVSETHSARLWLNDATGQVLRNGLTLIGVSAPERM